MFTRATENNQTEMCECMRPTRTEKDNETLIHLQHTTWDLFLCIRYQL